jgi:putative Ca2+/H+ antiporter (TMEM165/GDT1 family)
MKKLLSLFFFIIESYSISTVSHINETKDVEFTFNTSFINSFLIIFTSEIADKTFILLLFFSMKTSKIKLFIVSGVSLVTINILTVLAGFSLPNLFYRNFINWLGTITFLIFGIYLIQEACYMQHKTLQKRYEKYAHKKEIEKMQQINHNIENNTLHEPLNNVHNNDTSYYSAYQESENKLLLGFFTSLMIAECGDRSQLATITLGAVYEIYGTLLGTSVAHLLCNLIAICFGSVVAKYLSEKQMNYIGGVIFLLMGFDLLFLEIKILS